MRIMPCILATALAVTARGQQTPASAWRADAEALKTKPGLLRFYSFKTADAVQHTKKMSRKTKKPPEGGLNQTEPGVSSAPPDNA